MPLSDQNPDPVEVLLQEPSIGRRPALLNGINLIAPLLILVVAIVLLERSGDLTRVSRAVGVAFFALGKLIIVFGAAPDAMFKMTTWELAPMVVFMDLWLAYFLGFNLHFIYRVPRVGPWILRVMTFCRYVLEHRPWMRRWAFTGVFLFVFIPVTGTGAPAACILGRLVGLRATTAFLAITVGSVTGCFLLATFAARLEPVFEQFQNEWWFRSAGYAVLGILLLLLYRLGRRLSKAVNAFAQTPHQEAGVRK
ncbi:MAG: small multi-drug export protein [Planctomycetota bacterium]